MLTRAWASFRGAPARLRRYRQISPVPGADNSLILVYGRRTQVSGRILQFRDNPNIRRTVASLNELVISALIESDIPAVPVHPLSCVVADDAHIVGISSRPDCDDSQARHRACSAWRCGDGSGNWASIVSGDQLVTYLAAKFGAARIGFGTAVDGVIVDGATIPLITSETFWSVRFQIHGSEGGATITCRS
ncbi:MAG: hypothetical protein U9N61_01350 [Euryarchaeota archaeon]|nr:hypothetical protein [Euryarchaeota archaeon]